MNIQIADRVYRVETDADLIGFCVWARRIA